jgi:DNA repair protein RadC
MAITDWPAEERPREKLLSKGPASLSDAELLAIFLRSGTKGLTAVDLARNLLREFDGLRPLLEASQAEFCSNLGLGPAKYALLQAVLEMSRRHLKQTLTKPGAFNSPSAVKAYLTSQLRHLPHEVFCCLLLDNQNRLIHYQPLFQGTLDAASVYPREVVKHVLQHNAAAVIFAHNHPSGVAEPSDSDARITIKLTDALRLIDVRVLDHFIVGEAEVVSMAERGLLINKAQKVRY